jgi:hippurate hydrolase
MKISLLAAAATLLAAASPAHADALRDAVAKDMPSLLALYRDFHANPELSMQEVKTAAKLAAEVKKLGYQVTTGVGGTGVVAVMKNGPGPVLLLRADIDGLPSRSRPAFLMPARSEARARQASRAASCMRAATTRI